MRRPGWRTPRPDKAGPWRRVRFNPLAVKFSQATPTGDDISDVIAAHARGIFAHGFRQHRRRFRRRRDPPRAQLPGEESFLCRVAGQQPRRTDSLGGSLENQLRPAASSQRCAARGGQSGRPHRGDPPSWAWPTAACGAASPAHAVPARSGCRTTAGLDAGWLTAWQARCSTRCTCSAGTPCPGELRQHRPRSPWDQLGTCGWKAGNRFRRCPTRTPPPLRGRRAVPQEAHPAADPAGRGRQPA